MDRYYRRTGEKHIDKVYKFIKEYQEKYVITPTQETISNKFGLSQSNVTIVLRSLERQEKIKRGGGNYAIKIR